MRSEYPYYEAISDLELFFKSHIKDQSKLNEFLTYLEKCKLSKKLGFRYIHEELIRYRKECSDYFDYSLEEDKMMDDLMYFWG